MVTTNTSFYTHALLLPSLLLMTSVAHAGGFNTIRCGSQPYILTQILVAGGKEATNTAPRLKASNNVPVHIHHITEKSTEKKKDEECINIEPTGGGLCCNSLNGLWAAFSSYSMGIVLWDLRKNTSHHISTENPSKLLFSPQSTHLVWLRRTFTERDNGSHDASNYGKEIVVFNMFFGHVTKILSTSKYVYDMCFSHDNKNLVASHEKGISIWDLSRVENGFYKPINKVKFYNQEMVINLRASEGGHIAGLEHRTRSVFLWKNVLPQAKNLSIGKELKSQEAMFLGYTNKDNHTCHLEFTDSQNFSLVSLYGARAQYCKTSKNEPTISEFSGKRVTISGQWIQKIIYPSLPESTSFSESTCIVSQNCGPLTIDYTIDQPINIRRQVISHKFGTTMVMALPREATESIELSRDGALMIVDIAPTGHNPQEPIKILYAYQKVVISPIDLNLLSLLNSPSTSSVNPTASSVPSKTKKRKEGATKRKKSTRNSKAKKTS